MERSNGRNLFKENSFNSSCDENILQIIEYQHQTHQQQQQQQKQVEQQQQQQQHLQQLQLQQNLTKTKIYKHTLESSETLKSSSSTISLKSNTNLPTLANMQSRKKRLQRQKSTVYSGDETEYAADLEEEEDDDDDEVDEGYGPNERELSINLPVVSKISTQKKKQVRFRNKQQSESSLKLSAHTAIENTSSSSSLTSSLNSSGTAGSINCHERRLKSDGSFDSIPELPQCSNSLLQRQKGILKRDNSVHSDSSRYSSVDSLLEARKPDPEAILINLGFGPVGSEDILSRIPKRFLKPSQVRGIDTEAFIKRLQLANTLADHSVLGYRGLTGNPDIPPSHIVAKIMERFEVNERKKSLTSLELKLR